MTYSGSGGSYEHAARLQQDGLDFRIRFDYPLTPESVVFDVGAHDGRWTHDLINWHGFTPLMFLFEPVPNWYEQAATRFAGNNKICVYNVGLGSEYKHCQFLVDATDSYRTGAYSTTGHAVDVELRDILSVIEDLRVETIDLLAANIEGGEFELLERMIESGSISRVKNLLVQAHAVVPEAEARWAKICEGLATTHDVVYSYPFTWESWRRKL